MDFTKSPFVRESGALKIINRLASPFRANISFEPPGTIVVEIVPEKSKGGIVIPDTPIGVVNGTS